MVLSCSADGCTQRYEPGSGVTFHLIPKEKSRMKQWLIAMKREKWKPGNRSVLCSRHFSSDCYNTSPWSSRKSLKIDAVPSIFDFPEDLQKPSDCRPSPKKRNHTEDELDIISAAEKTLAERMILGPPTKTVSNKAVANPPKKKRRIFTGDFEGDPTQFSYEELCHFYQLAKKEIAKKCEQVKLLQQTNRRLQKKIEDCQIIINSN